MKFADRAMAVVDGMSWYRGRLDINQKAAMSAVIEAAMRAAVEEASREAELRREEWEKAKLTSKALPDPGGIG